MKLTDYIFGSRRGREANRIEREAMADPFLADAIEGYDTVYGAHADRLAELRQRVEEQASRPRRHPGRGRRMRLLAWSAAAAVVVAAGTVWYLGRPVETLPAEGIAQTVVPEAVPPVLREPDAGAEQHAVAVAAAPTPTAAAAPQRKEAVSDVSVRALPVPAANGSAEASGIVPATEERAEAVPMPASAAGAERAVPGAARAAEAEPSLSSEASEADTVVYPAFEEYVRRNRRRTTLADGTPARGRVVAEFRVNEAGVPSSIRIVSGISSEINREVIGMLLEGPRWEPTGGRRIRTAVVYE